MKFVAVSDLHIVPKGKASRGIDTAARLRKGLAELVANHSDAAFCVMAGDLCDHGEVGAYEYLREMIADLPMPVHLMIGNHDDRVNFRTVFADRTVDDDGFVQSWTDLPVGRFIFLDTYEKERSDGRLCERRLAWLDGALAGASNGAFVFLHHPPFRLGTFIDALRLVEHRALAEVMLKHGNVRHIFSGHTHRPCSGAWHGIPCATFGATTYNGGLHLADRPGNTPRYYTPGYSAVVLVDDEQVVIHANDFLSNNLEIDAINFGFSEQAVIASARQKGLMA